jgi:hypothetical protein
MMMIHLVLILVLLFVSQYRVSNLYLLVVICNVCLTE